MPLWPRRRRKIGIALSGGGARGLAHVGVLEVLLQAFADDGVAPTAIAGTSAGALFGALAAGGTSMAAVRNLASSFNGTAGWARLARPVLPGQAGMLSLAPLDKLLEDALGGRRTFEELPTPFCCIATDIERDEEVLLAQGDLRSAVRASCSVPGVFVPVERDGRVLVDGGVMNNLPVRCLLERGCDYVIAVDVLPGRQLPARPSSMLEVLLVSFYNLVRAASREARLANIVVTPAVRSYGFVDFEQREALIERGRQAARDALEQIRFDLGLGPARSWRTRFWGVFLDVRAVLARVVAPLRAVTDGAWRELLARRQPRRLPD